MLKKTIKFIDYAGNERTEDHYFNLNKSEATKMELSTTGGLTQMIENIIAAQDNPAIIKIFEDLILKSYGKKSPDGRRFMKSEEISRDFMETEAYDQLFMELITDPKKAAAFVNGVISFNEKDISKGAPQGTNITQIPQNVYANDKPMG